MVGDDLVNVVGQAEDADAVPRKMVSARWRFASEPGVRPKQRCTISAGAQRTMTSPTSNTTFLIMRASTNK